ncbi:MAG: DUF4331 family protein [Myxococcales bacterium]|mgnify:CR=1 FL=1|nr:DUF4331 family protein [Myxococcales bacterium]
MRRLLLPAMLGASAIAFGALAASCADDDVAVGPKRDAGFDATPPDAAFLDAGDAGADGGRPKPGQVDRMGRPAINTALVSKANKDEYNRSPTFDPATASNAKFAADFEAALDTIDALDGVDDWGGAAAPHPLTKPLLGDFLLLDTSKGCPVGPVDCPSYLDVELTVLGLQGDHQTFGGRTPNDDVMDLTLSLLVKGTAGFCADRSTCSVRDYIDGNAARKATNVFPYLSE